MREFISAISPILLLVLIFLVVFGLGFAIVGGLAIALGHLLMRFSSFSLFEATLLSVLFAAITISLIVGVIRALTPSGPSSWFAADDNDGKALDEIYDRIPTSRFYKTPSDMTWEAWLRSEIANDIYMEFQEDGNAVSYLNVSQAQELAIRLSGLAISILKRKKASSNNLAISKAALRQELTRTKQKPYGDRIMELALDAINMNVDYYNSDLVEIIRGKKWNELADPPADASHN